MPILRSLKKTIWAYGLIAGLLMLLLKLMDLRFMVRDISMEIYVGLVALFFTALGIWAGLKLTTPKAGQKPATYNSVPNPQKPVEISLSQRELEVLTMMSQGMSNQEIADKLFISLNTVKTHSSSLFSKLEVKRRTQAVQRGKAFGLIP